MRAMTFLAAIILALIIGANIASAADLHHDGKFHTKTIYNPNPACIMIQ